MIRTKQEMYEKLAAGEFGNTIMQFFSLDSWIASIEHDRYETWGVRTLTAGGPCRLYCPTEEVPETVWRYQSLGHRCNISCMIDTICTITAWMEIVEMDCGLFVYAIEYPKRGESWRVRMLYSLQFQGIAARQMLKKHLNASSYDDLEILLERYPSHVVELSAVEGCFGTVPLRNGIIWEVRGY